MASTSPDISHGDKTNEGNSLFTTATTSSPAFDVFRTATSTILSILTAAKTESTLSSSSATVGTSSVIFTSARIIENQTFVDVATAVSNEHRDRVLADRQGQTILAMIPAMIYLVVLALTGLIGNSLVLFVYSKKFKQTPTRVFIIAIASFDVVTNVVAIPGEIYDMFHIYDFDQPLVCKLRLYVNAFTTMVSAMVLVAVAAVRYRKICAPFKTQVSIRLARIITIVLTTLSLIFSVPYGIINGRQTKEVEKSVFGHECTIDDSYKGTIWPKINGAFFILLFISCSIPLVIMYICIGVAAYKRTKFNVVASYKRGSNTTQTNDSSNSADTGTKSTDGNSVQFFKSAKTKSYIKKNGDRSNGVSNSAGDAEKCSKSSSENHREENHRNTRSYNTRDEDDDDVETVEHDEGVNGNSKPKNSALSRAMNADNDYPVKVIRTHTGEKVQVNLKMVRELTDKLRAVKKETDHHQENDSEDNELERENAENNESDRTSCELFPDQIRTKKTGAQSKHDSSYEKNTAGNQKSNKSSISKRQRNKSADSNIGLDIALTSKRSKRFSKSLDDLHRLTEDSLSGKKFPKNKSAENEDLNLHVGANNLQESAVYEESETAKDEPMSEFAKAMQWVDLTYCLSEDQKNDSANSETNAEEPEINGTAKKGSFSLGRKISRDNSFLQRHRKLKDALTDTLTRARKSRREREVTEAEAKEYHITLENINSESENTCTNEDNENPTSIEENKTKSDEDKMVNESEVKVDIIEAKSGKKVRHEKPQVRQSRQEKSRGRQRGITRTTKMLILISAVYIFGFLPYLALMFAKNESPSTFTSMDIAGEALYNLFLRSYFLNSAANPVIYSLCDINFRRECFSLLKCS